MHFDETPFQRRAFWWITLVVFAIAGVGCALLLAYHGRGTIWRLLSVLGAAQVLGKWIIFSGLSPEKTFGFGPWTLALISLLADTVYTIVLSTGLAGLERTRWIGPLLLRARNRAELAFAAYPALRRMAFSGIALWVFLPLPASGAVSGSFAARLIGLSRAGAVGAVALGSVLNCALFALMATGLGANSAALIRNPVVTVAVAIVFGVALWIGWRRVRRKLQT